MRAVTHTLDKTQTLHLRIRIHAWAVARAKPDEFEIKYKFSKWDTGVSTFVQGYSVGKLYAIEGA